MILTLLFARFQSTFNPRQDKEVIFIDDSADNVNSAKSCNFTGLVYKGADKLADDLQKLGVTLERETDRLVSSYWDAKEEAESQII